MAGIPVLVLLIFLLAVSSHCFPFSKEACIITFEYTSYLLKYHSDIDGRSSNGRTTAFGAVYSGSNPGLPAQIPVNGCVCAGVNVGLVTYFTLLYCPLF